MRYIDLDLVGEHPKAATLIEAVNQARAEILAEPDIEQRKKLITAAQPKWVAFRALFQELFGAKCWYTESVNPGTDDDIDHYRPKGRLAEDETHDGYWWEALNWRNFRLSCHRANRLRINPDSGNTHGKGDHFPLLSEAERCHLPSDDLEKERPTLLDPTDPTHPPLLTFNIDGTVAVAPEYANDADAERRVDDSRIYLHLEWPAIKEARQDVFHRIRTRVNDGDLAMPRFDRGEPAGKETMRTVVRDLVRWTRDREPYSRAARAFVRVFRDRDWVARYVLPNLPHGT